MVDKAQNTRRDVLPQLDEWTFTLSSSTSIGIIGQRKGVAAGSREIFIYTASPLPEEGQGGFGRRNSIFRFLLLLLLPVVAGGR